VSGARASPAERVYLELVAEYQTAILNFIYRLVGDADLAEDLTQETYVKAYEALGRLELGPEAAARRRAWLYRIARNTATDHLRRRARLSWLPLDAVRQRGGGDPDRKVAAREPVRKALDALTDEQREVLLLFSHVGLSGREVADVLGVTPAAARKRRQRAREAFEVAYRRFADSGPDEEDRRAGAEAGPDDERGAGAGGGTATGGATGTGTSRDEVG
jgi:RNA polymerase sigma-70 factor (ECF subfamily)